MGVPDIEARQASLGRADSSDVSKAHVEVGRENLHAALPPHESYEGAHRFDPTASWDPEEERRVVRKTDIRLLSWLCLMVSVWPAYSPHA